MVTATTRHRFVTETLDDVLADIRGKEVISLDLETTGLNPIDSRILLCQVGTSDIDWVIDVRKVSLEPLLPILRDRDVRKIIFNADFEDKFFQHFYKTGIYNVFDCYLAERVLAPDERSGQAFEDLALRYLDVKLDKAVRKSFASVRKDFTERQIKYAAEDVQYLFPLYEQQQKALAEKNLIHVAELEFALATVTASMELAGVAIDVEKWRAKIREYETKLVESREKMFSIMFDDNDVLDEQLGMFERVGINLQSPKQILEAFNKLGIDMEKTDERTISLINHPAAQELLTYRKIQKIINAYGYKLLDKIHPFTQKIHAEFRQVGTETGRYSCAEPNLQQMPEEFRECFKADEGHLFVGADYSQIELRVLAELSQDPKLVAAFTSGLDLHSATASAMFDVPIEKVTKDQRFAAKTLNFGLTYGMGPEKLMDSLNAEAKKDGRPQINMRQAQAIHSKYKATYRGATDWLDNTGKRALRSLYAETIFGRKRFFNLPTSNLDRKKYENQLAGIKRQGANTPIQGTSADITKAAMLSLHETLQEYGYRGKLILTVHDEIVVLAHNTQAEAIKDVVVECMIRSGQELIKSVPIKVDAFISEIWKKG